MRPEIPTNSLQNKAYAKTLLFCLATCFVACRMGAANADDKPAQSSPPSLTVLVMDPLSSPLACDCVQGYAQRDYEALGGYLQRSLKKPVQVVWSESITSATKEHGAAHVIIGKHSVVLSASKKAGQRIQPIAQLTGLDGKVTQTGLIVVRKDDSAQSVADLKGYRILFGPKDCEEKRAAPMQTLKASGIELPQTPETSSACSEAAALLLEMDANVHAAAVISSYAKPLLSGCGTVKKGDLRVIGESKPVPFITAFASTTLPQEDRQAIRKALLDVELEPQLMIALESAEGFKRWTRSKKKDTKLLAESGKRPEQHGQQPAAGDNRAPRHPSRPMLASQASVADLSPTNDAAEEVTERTDRKLADTASTWIQWRGSAGDGSTAWLPKKLPDPFEAAWTVPVAGNGVGGLCANADVVIVSGRDLLDKHDVFQCFDQKTGDLLWQHFYPASGNLDYGNSPRATPYLFEDVVYTLGAFGHLYCLDLETGIPYWQRNLASDFNSFDLTWGHSVSPIVVNQQLIVQPGGRRGFLAALDPDTGETIWKSTAAKGGYSGMATTSIAHTPQLITYDSASLGGWSLKDGRRLWTLVPPEKGDFNVPTVIVRGNQVLASTENNGTRWYSLTSNGIPQKQPTAHNTDLAPDCHSPVISGRRIFGVWNELYALDATTLETEWSSNDDAFAGYAALIAAPDRVLCLSEEGEVLLISSDQATPQIVSRHQLTPRTTRFLSHPAIANRSLFVRVDRSLKKFDLSSSK